MISLFRSRNGLRYYLFRGIGLSILLILGIFGVGAWQVYHTGSQPLPRHVRADAALVLGAAAWDKRPSPVFRERINHAITLYQSHRVEKIVFTGGTSKKGYMTEAEVGRRYAPTSSLKTPRATPTKTSATSVRSCAPKASKASSSSATPTTSPAPSKSPPTSTSKPTSPPRRPRGSTKAKKKTNSCFKKATPSSSTASANGAKTFGTG